MAQDDTLPVKSNGMESQNSTEPTELDPCVEDSKNGKIRTNDFFYRYRDEICDKSGLSHKGVYIIGGIIVVALLLVIVVIALAAAWPRVSHEYQFPVCKDAACLRAAAQIQEGLNKTVSPCNDLWSSVCGGWLQKYPLPKDRSIWNQKHQLVRRETERVRDLIATLKLPLLTETVEWKMKTLYDACIDVDSVDSDKDGPLIDIITELGGWYILRDWSEVAFDQKAILGQLHAKYGVSPFFKISVESNPNMPGHNSIRISPAGLGLPDKEYYYRDEDDRIQVAYKEYIRDVIIYLSSNARNEASKFGIDMFSYEKRIAEVTPDSISLQNPISTYNPVSLSELKDTNLIPFYDILQAMYPESNITEQTEVIVTSLEYLSQIAQIISSTDRKTMNGYLIWTLVRNYIPYLSQQYTSAMDSFNAELIGTEKPLPRWEWCAGLVRRFMGLAINNYLDQANPVSEKTQKVVNSTFDFIVDVVTNRISKFEHTAFLYKHLKLKLSTLRMQIGVPERARNETFLRKNYLMQKVLKRNFFTSVKNSINLQRRLEEEKLSNTNPDLSIIDYALEEIPKVVYSSFDHVVIIPRSLLVDPVFEHNYPSSIIYGRLGVEIAEAVISSILPYDSLWTADRKILSPFHMTVEESIRTVQSCMKCLSNYVLNLNLDIPYGAANETSLNILRHISAISVANEALRLSLEEKEHIHQPSLESYEDEALFFLSYAQTQCSETTYQQRLYENMVQFQLPQKSMLLLAWVQLPEFSESLQCSYNRKIQCSDIF